MYNDKYTHIEILCQQKPIDYYLITLRILEYYLILGLTQFSRFLKKL